MNGFPADVFFQSLKFGTVIRLSHPKFPDKPHFFVLVDYSDTAMPPIISLISSKSSKKKRNFVEVPLGRFAAFTKDSYIDCDQLYDFTPKKLYELYQKQILTVCGQLDNTTLQDIVNSCEQSTTLEGEDIERIKKAFEKL